MCFDQNSCGHEWDPQVHYVWKTLCKVKQRSAFFNHHPADLEKVLQIFFNHQSTDLEKVLQISQEQVPNRCEG